MGIPLFMYKRQPGIDQTKVDQGIRLSAQAVELDQTGTTVAEKEEALFTYFLSLKNFLEALLSNLLLSINYRFSNHFLYFYSK
jgi:hypothetical protein